MADSEQLLEEEVTNPSELPNPVSLEEPSENTSHMIREITNNPENLSSMADEQTTSTVDVPNPIRSLSPSLAQKISADRVIGSIGIALKELLENSIDAGSTHIQLRIKEYGLNEIEVVDNGCGIQECDFETLAKSHTTSKLASFEELDSIETFGFRGEALNSLCRLCNGIVITTKHATSRVAHRLQFDATGTLISKTPCLGLGGTKVVLKKLFSVLPVRQKVLALNHKQEFFKAIHLIHSYCIIAEDVRIRVTHQPTQKKDYTLVTQTQGGTLLENIGIVLGHSIAKALIPLPSSQTATSENSEGARYEFKGFISSCEHGRGRGAPDKQFFFVNGRPCNLPKVQKLVNQLYKQYNKHQHPVVVMNIITNSSSKVDVNLDPDKRKVVLSSEACLLDQVKDILTALFEKLTSLIPLNLSATGTLSSPGSIPTPKLADFFKLSRGIGTATATHSTLPNIPVPPTTDKSTTHSTSIYNFPLKIELSDPPASSSQSTPVYNAALSIPVCEENLSKSATATQVEQAQSGLKSLSQFQFRKMTATPGSSRKRPSDSMEPPTKTRRLDVFVRRKHPAGIELDNVCKLDPIPEALHERSPPAYSSLFPSRPESHAKTEHEERAKTGWEEAIEQVESNVGNIQCGLEAQTGTPVSPQDPYLWTTSYPISPPKKPTRKEVSMKISLEAIEEAMRNYEEEQPITEPDCTAFTVPLTGDPSEAEKELSKQVTKEKFAQMTIIGQFNSAFILTRLDDHIFIIDQHAADEKYNYEKLSKEAKTQSQRLIIPQSLILNPAQEFLFLENKNIFLESGFQFTINEEADAENKVQITAVPTFLHEEFKLDDIIEMLHQIEESPHMKPMPSRMKALLASRACRSSIMIGDILDMAAMRRLVDNMGTMDHPWNCPHGRPTMRHLTGFMFEEVFDD